MLLGDHGGCNDLLLDTELLSNINGLRDHAVVICGKLTNVHHARAIAATREQRVMTKAQFLKHIAAIYHVGNNSDGIAPDSWTVPDMAGELCCQHLDKLICDLIKSGVITEQEWQDIFWS